MGDWELSDGERQELGRILEGRHGKLKLITLRGNGRALIVKTTADVAAELREKSSRVVLGKKEVSAVLTSGAIGKLKRRAAGSDDSQWRSS